MLNEIKTQMLQYVLFFLFQSTALLYLKTQWSFMKTEMRKTQFKFIVNGYSMVDFNPIANPLPPKY